MTPVGRRCQLGPVAGLVMLLAGAAVAEAQSYVWTERTPPPGFRHSHAMVYDSIRGTTVLFGGLAANGVPLGDTLERDGTTGVWTLRSSSGPAGRVYHALAYDSVRGVTVLFGGYNSSGCLGDTWEWDGSTWTQRASTGPVARAGHAMAYDSVRGVTVLSGGSAEDGVPFRDTWEWDGTTWTQRSSSGPAARQLHTMVYDCGRGVTVLFGGTSGSDYLGDTWEWNGATGTWTQCGGSGPAARYGHATVYDSARGVSVLFGGSTAGGSRSDTWEWNGTTWTQRAGSGPSVRYSHAMVYDGGRGVTVLFGGTTGTSYFGDAWEWDGTTGTWTQCVGPGPSVRQACAMAYDSARGVTVLFGGAGVGGVLMGDTWEWNGTTRTWTQRSSSGPPVRDYHAMVYDSARRVTVLFGGNGASGYLADTWEWNGTTGTWTQRSSSGPSARHAHAMAYDTARRVTVLFGGDGYAGGNLQYLGDTWEWNGTAGTWAQRSSTGPAARCRHAMAYDGSRGVSVLFGGCQNGYGGYSVGDTWEWNGTVGTWTLRSNTGPPARYHHAMVYDSVRAVNVLFGGIAGASSLFGDTWEYPDRVPPAISIGLPAPSAVCAGGTVSYLVTYTDADLAAVTLGAPDVTLSTTGDASGTVSVSGSGATSPATRTVTISNITGSGTISISIAANTASDAAGHATAAAGPSASFTVRVPTTITQQPLARDILGGGTATFSVSAIGAGTLAYRWQKNDVDLCDGGHYAGATTAMLTVSSAGSAEAANYRCIVTGACGAVTSDEAVLTVSSYSTDDLDRDGDVDNDDWLIFASCFAGPGLLPGCTPDLDGDIVADFDKDGDVDLADYVTFQRGWSVPEGRQ